MALSFKETIKKFNKWHDPKTGRFTTAPDGGFSAGGSERDAKINAYRAKVQRTGPISKKTLAMKYGGMTGEEVDRLIGEKGEAEAYKIMEDKIVNSWIAQNFPKDDIPKGGKTGFNEMSDDEKVELLHKAISDADIPGTLNVDSYTQRFIYNSGLNDKPTEVKNYKEYDAYDAKNIYRGVKDIPGVMTADEMIEMTCYGDLTFVGDGIFGDGLYFSDNSVTAQEYATKNGMYMSAKIKKEAKVVDYDKLIDEFYVDRNNGNKIAVELVKLVNEKGVDNSIPLGVYALCKGYDVISKQYKYDEMYYNVLNRGALLVLEW